MYSGKKKNTELKDAFMQAILHSKYQKTKELAMLYALNELYQLDKQIDQSQMHDNTATLDLNR